LLAAGGDEAGSKGLEAGRKSLLDYWNAVFLEDACDAIRCSKNPFILSHHRSEHAWKSRGTRTVGVPQIVEFAPLAHRSKIQFRVPQFGVRRQDTGIGMECEARGQDTGTRGEGWSCVLISG
jgi:hypothetical protein